MNKGVRIINFVIDIIVISVISSIFSAIVGNPIGTKLIFFLVFLLYYFLLEIFFCQTLGKIATKTIVVDVLDSKPGILKILLRTLLRLNPFDIISYLFGINLGTHDVLSKTKLKPIKLQE